jgi:hypothetical protein
MDILDIFRKFIPTPLKKKKKTTTKKNSFITMLQNTKQEH